jgi:uncharacterized phage protein gp47/JayE
VPIVSTGYETRTLAEIVEAVQDELRARISDKLDLSERTALGNIVQIFCDHLSQVEQVASEAYAAFDVDAASDDRLVALGLLIGVPRRGATKGLVTATVNLQASKSYAAGDLVAHVQDEADNRWVNRDAVVSTTAGNYQAVFEAETAGAAGVAPAGTLTVLAQPVDGWNTITNALDATEGTDIEAIEDLRLRMQLAVSSGGSRTRGAIRAKLVQLEGVIAAEVFENTTSVTDANGLPPHSIRVSVWDGSPAAADDDAIAQVVFDHKAEGIVSDGGESGTAQDEVLGPVTVNFSRATNSVATIAVAIESAAGVAITDVEDAIIAAMPQLVGEALVYNKIAAAVFKVPGVDDWTTLTINAGTADLPATVGTIYTTNAGAISVSGDVS